MSDSPWPVTTHILAYIADTVAFSRADYVNAHGGSMKPKAIPRPGEETVSERRQQVRDLHDALHNMASGGLDPRVVAALRRDAPQLPQVEVQ
ncbi:hypothetical protein KALB_4972 [Kutzneria albida DSM 43870]|uniref:Uncharacterized protein n=2 Tax=Kutzneria TaxID=43356 RepID=W5WJJ3_9PSEU|nr:hypothetical protein KALB_4972 [Kutzneria albida DSM 43870]